MILECRFPLRAGVERRLLLRAWDGSLGDGERGVLRENKKERETATLIWN